VLLQGGARRLLEATATESTLVSTITFPGTIEAAQQAATILSDCGSNCTGVANVSVIDVGALQGTPENAPASVVTLERVDTPAGDPYQFRTTYTTAGAPDSVIVTLDTRSEPDSMSCSPQVVGTGVTLFTCRPLKALPAVTLTALAINRQNVNDPVTASVTVLNTSKGSCSRTWVDVMQHMQSVLVLIIFCFV
jgi:hypothetical protein